MSLVLVQVIVGGLLLGAVYALFTSGLTLVWGMMNVVNFAHGDFVMLGMYVAFVVYTVMGGGPLLGAPLAILLLATLGIVAFVTVSLGGFGSVPGALVAGLLIGVIESLSSYLIGAVYKNIVVYALFLGLLWFRPQGLMGKM
jgi:branched-subunit amino acid ABC-type transport system permease component